MNKQSLKGLTTVLLFLSSLLFGIHIYYIYTESTISGFDLSGKWQICTTNHETLNSNTYPTNEIKNCKWESANLPPGNPAQQNKEITTYILRKQFVSPEFCIDKPTICTLFIFSLTGEANFFLNRIQIGQYGNFVDSTGYSGPYASQTDIPKMQFKQTSENNELLIIHKYYPKISSRMYIGRVQILPKSHAHKISTAFIADILILPLICSLALVTLGLLAFFASIVRNSHSNFEKNLLISYIAYCIIAALNLLGLSRLPRTVLPYQLAFDAHYFIRLLSDIAFFSFITQYFNKNGLINKIINLGLYFFSFLLFFRVVLFAFGANEDAWHLDAQTTRAIAMTGFIFTTLAFILAFTYSLEIKSEHRSYIRNFFLVLLAVHLYDYASVVFLAPEYYFNRFFPLLVGITFGFIIWRHREEQIQKLEIDASISKLFAQVAHDIRAPIGALCVAVNSLPSIPNDTKILFDSAINRIREITNNVLNTQKSSFEVPLDQIHVNELVTIIQASISDFLSDHKQENNIVISFENNTKNPSQHILILRPELSRILSNLLHNSFEARDKERVEIFITLINNSKEVTVIIRDNGKGIPQEALSKLGMRGRSFGKIHGYGLGIAHAKQTIDNWNGKFQIRTEIEKYTEIKITLPSFKT